MKCVNCSFENEEDARFCENCGQPLARKCPSCGNEVSPNARFCKTCGFSLMNEARPSPAAPAPGEAPGFNLQPPASSPQPPTPGPEPLDALRRAAPQAVVSKVLAERGRLEGERKVVTTLFADIVGSTALAEQMDPEDWRDVVSGAHRRVGEAVYRYEGTVAQLLGDGVLAFFGAPIAHEDDPERAVRAALSILDAIAGYAADLRQSRRVPDFQVRIGLNTGLVVVGNIGTDLHVEYLAVGDTVNLAARLQSAAEPNTILISDSTHRLTERLFEFKDGGKVTVKGKVDPVQVYRVLGERRTVTRTRGIEGLDSPLIGRDREYQMLRARVDALLAGQGGVVALLGEAGLGKSRLVAELRKWLIGRGMLRADDPERASSGRLGWYEGRSLSYDASTPFAAFVDLFGKLLDLGRTETDAARYGKITGYVDQVMPGRGAEIAPFLAALLGVVPTGEDADRVKYLEPPQLRERVFGTVLSFFETLAADRPVVLFFEDIHWMDPTSLALVEQLMPLAGRVPLMILTAFRPRRDEPSWHLHEVAMRDYPGLYTSVMLQPLDEGNSRTLVANLLHVEDLPEKVRSLILAKAEGNPFFVEEVIRSLLDARLVVRENSHWRATREIEDIAVPDTLVGVIAARLDRLDDDAKRIAQVGAVIGREFQRDVLGRVSGGGDDLDPVLGNLERRELIRGMDGGSRPGYRFKHALIQETAYASILLSKRRELHRLVAEYLEAADTERVTDIARHFVEAQEGVRALPYLLAAGDAAARAYATQEAIAFYEEVLEILKVNDNPEVARRAYEGLGAALTFANEIARAVESYDTMYHYGQARDDPGIQISALNKLSYVVALRLGQFPEAEQHLGEAERLAREVHDMGGLAEHFWVRCMMCTATGDFDGAFSHLTESVQIGRDLGLKEQLAFGLTHVAGTLTMMARFDEAWLAAQEAIQVSKEIGRRDHVARLLGVEIPMIHLRNGDLDAAIRAAEEGAAEGEQIGETFAAAQGTWTAGVLHHERGEYEAAIAWYRRSIRAARSVQDYMPFLLVLGLGGLGMAYLDISEQLDAEVAEVHTEALKWMEHPASTMSGAVTWGDLGFCVLERGLVDQAGEFFEKALTIPSVLWVLQRPRLLVGRAYVALARGDLETAERTIAEAREFAEERGMKNNYPLLAYAAAEVYSARRDWEQALEEYTRAESQAAEMTMRPLVWKARAGAARALDHLGRLDSAEAKRREAIAAIDEIAGLFQDKRWCEMFVENATRKVQPAL